MITPFMKIFDIEPRNFLIRNPNSPLSNDREGRYNYFGVAYHKFDIQKVFEVFQNGDFPELETSDALGIINNKQYDSFPDEVKLLAKLSI